MRLMFWEERRDSMDPSLEAMHPLDPPPPDVLLALLARNKALEGRIELIPNFSGISIIPT